jgi:DNA polymerase I-like protein with 3'-5' exonuclease and polymerase domains
MDEAAEEAQKYGFVQTILGRRSRFEVWEPRNIDYQNRAVPMRYENAIRNYGSDIIRANTHKGINRKLQGSAADMIKAGMHKCWKDGVFDVIGVPKLQVHDELDFSVISDTPEQREGYKYMKHVLENALPLRVPVLVDAGRGKNWGEID